MRRKLGISCMLLGTALVLAALSLFLYNQRQAGAAADAAQEVLTQMVQQLAPEASESPAALETAPQTAPYDTAMAETLINGYAYIGYLSIPALELDLPIMSTWDYTRLNIAPCRYYGSVRTRDLVLCGHNYPLHFGKLSNLQPGDAVYFVNVDGEVYPYQVALVEILDPYAVEEMISGEYPLTLYTCTYGGQNRVTVRCEGA